MAVWVWVLASRYLQVRVVDRGGHTGSDDAEERGGAWCESGLRLNVEGKEL
jgi:hypothetical protein